MIPPAVPELTEEVLHEAIDARTDQLPSLRELGPPDLVHLLRQVIRNPSRQTGIYHHVTGVDASSSASVAAYINTLVYKDQGPQATTKIVEGVYCCYNAFSRVDMRVHVSIPGTVEAYCIDERGERQDATDDLWLETYLCSVLRAYSYADDGSGDAIRKIIGVRRFNPVTNQDTEDRFLHAASQLFFRGWQLGSDSVVQVPNAVSNHLTAGLLRYFETTGRFASGIRLFDKLRGENVQVSSLLAKLLFMANEEVEGIRALYHALKELPMDYLMLDTQAEFLLKKASTAQTPEQREEYLRMALGCADRSTIAAPSEFSTWARLAQVYVQLEDWDNALTILNSCPMFTYQDKDTPLMPPPKDVYLPVLAEARLDEIEAEPEARANEQMDPNLHNLRAASYKGTFKAAYAILTEMTAKIGWDQLLKIRSSVFVMEDEYRSEKQEASTPAQQRKRSPSTDVLRGSTDGRNGGGAEDDAGDAGGDAKSDAGGGGDDGGEHTNGEGKNVAKPGHAVDATETDAIVDSARATDGNLSKLNNKRLCERWLDALFMVLYEDLRVYTIWRTQIAQYRAQSILFRKTAEEWEILGSLAERLQHMDEAAEAYRSCLGLRFSPKALAGILRSLERRRAPTRDTIEASIRLVTWQYRWYSEFSPELLGTIRRLVDEDEAVKVRSIIQATSLPQHVLDLTHHYAALCALFRSGGGVES